MTVIAINTISNTDTTPATIPVELPSAGSFPETKYYRVNMQPDTQTEGHKDKQTEGHTDRGTHRHTDRGTHRQTDRGTHRQRDTQTEGHTQRDTQTEGQTRDTSRLPVA